MPTAPRQLQLPLPWYQEQPLRRWWSPPGEVAAEARCVRQHSPPALFGKVALRLGAGRLPGWLELEWEVGDEQIPPEFQRAVAEGLLEALRETLEGERPMAAARVRVVGGVYHLTDSNERAFRTAAAMALRQALAPPPQGA